jgi:hypothetical protein
VFTGSFRAVSHIVLEKAEGSRNAPIGAGELRHVSGILTERAGEQNRQDPIRGV